MSYWVVAGPYAWLIALAALLPAAAVAGATRRGWRTRRGRCANCGYDVRASPERCPECGHGNVVAAGAGV